MGWGAEPHEGYPDGRRVDASFTQGIWRGALGLYDDPDAVVAELDRILAIPSEESEIRKALARIELRIREEVRGGGEWHAAPRRGTT